MDEDIVDEVVDVDVSCVSPMVTGGPFPGLGISSFHFNEQSFLFAQSASNFRFNEQFEQSFKERLAASSFFLAKTRPECLKMQVDILPASVT